MALVFIPFDDLSVSAIAATPITSIDYSFIQAGEEKSHSFRIGNTSAGSVSLTLVSSSDLVSLLPATSFTLAPDQITDTITATINVPLSALTVTESIVLTATSDEGATSMTLDYVSVGANTARDSEYPERRTTLTDTISNTILRASEPLKLLKYEPIPYDPDDTRVFISDKKRHLDIGGDHSFVTQSVDERLNPLNETWGYVRSESIILGSFQDIETDILTDFVADKTSMNYRSTAKLFVPPEYEFPRTCALFSDAEDPDDIQYKKTVYLILRRGEFWALHTIQTRFRGNELAHHEIDLVQLEPRNMGSPDFYNPFAWTWRYEADKPYAKFVTTGIDFSILISDTSAGSNASNANPSDTITSPNPSSDDSDEEEPDPEPEPETEFLLSPMTDEYGDASGAINLVSPITISRNIGGFITRVAFIFFDISSLAGKTIDTITLNWGIDARPLIPATNNFVNINRTYQDPATDDPSSLLTDITSGTIYTSVVSSISAFNTDLGLTAVAELQSNIDFAVGYFGVGITWAETGQAATAELSDDPTLLVTTL